MNTIDNMNYTYIYIYVYFNGRDKIELYSEMDTFKNEEIDIGSPIMIHSLWDSIFCSISDMSISLSNSTKESLKSRTVLYMLTVRFISDST